MVKEFLYRGIPKEELENTSLEKLFLLFNSRQRRSLTRGITDGKRKLIEEIKAAEAGKMKNPIKTHVRDLIILPYMVGVTVDVFSGKEFRPVEERFSLILPYSSLPWRQLLPERLQLGRHKCCRTHAHMSAGRRYTGRLFSDAKLAPLHFLG